MAYQVKMGWSKTEAHQMWKSWHKWDWLRQQPNWKEINWKDIKVDDEGKVSVNVQLPTKEL